VHLWAEAEKVVAVGRARRSPVSDPDQRAYRSDCGFAGESLAGSAEKGGGDSRAMIEAIRE